MNLPIFIFGSGLCDPLLSRLPMNNVSHGQLFQSTHFFSNSPQFVDFSPIRTQHLVSKTDPPTPHMVGTRQAIP
jgi:hypothetical protein